MGSFNSPEVKVVNTDDLDVLHVGDDMATAYEKAENHEKNNLIPDLLDKSKDNPEYKNLGVLLDSYKKEDVISAINTALDSMQEGKYIKGEKENDSLNLFASYVLDFSDDTFIFRHQQDKENSRKDFIFPLSDVTKILKEEYVSKSNIDQQELDQSTLSTKNTLYNYEKDKFAKLKEGVLSNPNKNKNTKGSVFDYL